MRATELCHVGLPKTIGPVEPVTIHPYHKQAPIVADVHPGGARGGASEDVVSGPAKADEEMGDHLAGTDADGVAPVIDTMSLGIEGRTFSLGDHRDEDVCSPLYMHGQTQYEAFPLMKNTGIKFNFSQLELILLAMVYLAHHQ